MGVSNPNLFVVSGGPESGKTTVLHELASLGFACAPEVARQIIREQAQSGGTALPWRDREAYTRLMLQRSIESYRTQTPASCLVFSDRGIPDVLCYPQLIGLSDPGFILDACRQYRYGPVVFLAPPWKEIYETDNEENRTSPKPNGPFIKWLGSTASAITQYRNCPSDTASQSQIHS